MWIIHVRDVEAVGHLKDLSDRTESPDDNAGNIKMARSLGPRGMEGHMALCK